MVYYGGEIAGGKLTTTPRPDNASEKAVFCQKKTTTISHEEVKLNIFINNTVIFTSGVRFNKWELALHTTFCQNDNLGKLCSSVVQGRPRPPQRDKASGDGSRPPLVYGQGCDALTPISHSFFCFFLLSNFCVKQPGVVRRDQRPQPHPHRDRGEG